MENSNNRDAYEEQDEVLHPLSSDAKSVRAGRRKFITSAAAAPVLLSLTGRSALACSSPTNPPQGLSCQAWHSYHVGGACASHSPQYGNPCGNLPCDWKPKCTSTYQQKKTFRNQSGVSKCDWPSTVKPFDTCVKPVYDSYGRDTGKVQTIKYSYSQQSYYQDLPRRKKDGQCAGWKTGSLPPAYFNDSRTCSEILCDEADFDSLKAHLVAAYLNCKRDPYNYPVKLTELELICREGKLVPGGQRLSDSDLRAFLKQTCKQA